MAFNAKKTDRRSKRKGKMDIQCYDCLEYGHIARNCTKKKSNEEENTEDNRQLSMMATNVPGNSNSFMIDSGATQHICGQRHLFIETRPHCESILTAMGTVETELSAP